MTLLTEKILASVTLALVLHPAFQWMATHTSATGSSTWLMTPMDRAVPVVPGAVWLYVSWYPASLMGLFTDRATVRRLYIAFTIAFVVCMAGYVLLPATIDRPSIAGHGPSAVLLNAVYLADRPTNLFPSYHAAVAGILMHLPARRRLSRIGLRAWMLGICVACVLTKQHYVLDVLAGLAVGSFAARAAHHIVTRRPAVPRASRGVETVRASMLEG